MEMGESEGESEEGLEKMRGSVDKLYFDLNEMFENYEIEMKLPGFAIVLITYATELLSATEPESGAAVEVIASAVALGIIKNKERQKTN